MHLKDAYQIFDPVFMELLAAKSENSAPLREGIGGIMDGSHLTNVTFPEKALKVRK
jgi:hypothetical protein